MTSAPSTAPLAALLASHPEECAAVVAVLSSDGGRTWLLRVIEREFDVGAPVVQILRALEDARVIDRVGSSVEDWFAPIQPDRRAIARMGAAAWLAARVGAPAPMTRAQAIALAETIEGPRVGWDHLDVGALVRHLLLGDSLDQRPHVARVVEGGRKRTEREAAWAAKCLANEMDGGEPKGEQ